MFMFILISLPQFVVHFQEQTMENFGLHKSMFFPFFLFLFCHTRTSWNDSESITNMDKFYAYSLGVYKFLLVMH